MPATHLPLGWSALPPYQMTLDGRPPKCARPSFPPEPPRWPDGRGALPSRSAADDPLRPESKKEARERENIAYLGVLRNPWRACRMLPGNRRMSSADDFVTVDYHLPERRRSQPQAAAAGDCRRVHLRV